MAAWWNTREDFDDRQLRDPSAPLHSRVQDYRKRIAAAHGVDEASAGSALNHVIGAMESRSNDPTHYGFASSIHSNRRFRPQTRAKLWTPSTWHGAEDTQVSLHQPIHATQNYIRPSGIAHNLFHPGSRPAEMNEGDPDYDPQQDHEMWHVSDDSAHFSDEDIAMHAKSRFLQRRNGKLEVIDGHHRVAGDMLLGKSHTPGLLLHERDL